MPSQVTVMKKLQETNPIKAMIVQLIKMGRFKIQSDMWIITTPWMAKRWLLLMTFDRRMFDHLIHLNNGDENV